MPGTWLPAHASGLRLNERRRSCYGATTVIHGYHLILAAYGFWMPNDPRGSWSEFVGKWELVRFGRNPNALGSRSLSELTAAEPAAREGVRRSLKSPPVQFSGVQARAIGCGFTDALQHSDYTIWACTVLPEHTHLVIARHR